MWPTQELLPVRTNSLIVEEKYGKRPAHLRGPASKNDNVSDHDDDTESSTDSEEEDDEGILATGALDEQFHATLEAIRAKDPRVYDEKATFYIEPDPEVDGLEAKKGKQKPMYLSDYHRKNLLEGITGEDGEYDNRMTYVQQQDDLKTNVVKEMHAAVDGLEAGYGGDDDGFLVQKPSIPEAGKQGATVKPAITELNVETAHNDPDNFLLKFMSARAWVPSENSNPQPFESDDDEDDRRAELFEEAYNLRFEDPKGSNEKLLSHARDAAAKYSIRRDTTNPRKKARDAERAKKETEKQEREEGKARLRKLRIADAEEKVRKIREAAGLRGTAFQESDWTAFLEEGWDDDRWEQEMKNRFGEDYYADRDLSGSGDEAAKRRRKIKKPKWTTDIDIKDLVPDFDAEDEIEEPPFTLTDDESGHGDTDQPMTGAAPAKPRKTSKVIRKQERDGQKGEARKERRKIEQLVDEELHANETISGLGTKHTGQFRYRATSPLAYGLTAHDILMASDGQLNQYAGLKKMAAFRDTEKKRRDKKRLGKKTRLRQWRKETFGNEHGPQKTLAELLAGKTLAGGESTASGISQAVLKGGTKGRTRSRNSRNKG